MLQNTFIHIQGIGAITEQRLWESGLRDWASMNNEISIPLSAGRKYLLDKGIEESLDHLRRCNPSYFSKLLPSNQSWRLFLEFKESTVYLDIETTGLDRYFNDITTIALYDGESIQTYVQGQNLDDFIEDIQKYKVIVSYNGKSMVTAYNMKLKDTPFYETHFIEEPTLPINPFRADLATVDKIKNSSQYWQSQQWY
jgi:uncharacterized protein YprB with RNaseH-like and TPR domain